MHPILFRIPLFGLFGLDSFPIHTYGVLVAMGFIAGSLIVKRNALRQGEDPVRALDLVFYILIAAIVGSRLAHVLIAEREIFFSNPLYLFEIWKGGLVFYGGFIAAVGVSLWYFRKHRLPTLKYFDLFAPGIALGHGIGRLGCFFAGCCHGRPLLNKTWFSVTFPFDPNSSAPPGVPLYPTQLIEAFAEGLIFLFLAWRLGRKKFDGEIIALYCILYAAVRFVIEFYRGDAVRGFVFGGALSTSQFIGIILFAFGAGFYLYRRKKGALS